MYKVMINDKVRINKTKARQWYNAGRLICLCLNNTCPDNIQHIGYMWIDKFSSGDIDFDKLVNTFEIYSGCTELGKYATYYVKENVIYETADILKPEKYIL